MVSWEDRGLEEVGWGQRVRVTKYEQNILWTHIKYHNETHEYVYLM